MSHAATPPTTPAVEPSEAAAPVESPLRGRAIRGVIWTMGSKYSAQAIRLASNLILTRLLFPEAFGLMAVVNLVAEGLNLFSDVGIRPAIVQHERGDERSFLDTAWTIQVIRGVCLWCATCGIAGLVVVLNRHGVVPSDSAWADPLLPWMLPVAGLTSVAAGFTSTKLVTLQRRLTLGRDAAYTVGGRLLAAAIMVGWALVHPTVWALVGGTVVGTAVMAAASHYILPGRLNRFTWDRDSARELIRFGRWVFLSTALTFLATRADRLVLGVMLPADLLGLYAIAFMLAMVLAKSISQVSQKVLFPLYVQLSKRGGDSLRRNVRRVRLCFLAAALPLMWAVAIGGQWIVNLLYDQRYIEAGWMLKILAVGAIGQIICTTVQPIILAHGHSGRHLGFTTLSLLITAATMGLLGALYGGTGVIIAVAVSEVLRYAAVAWAVRPYRVWTPWLDLAAFASTAVVLLIGWSLV